MIDFIVELIDSETVIEFGSLVPDGGFNRFSIDFIIKLFVKLQIMSVNGMVTKLCFNGGFGA